MSKIEPWPEIRCEPIVESPFLSVERSITRSPLDGTEQAYFRVRSVDWVQVIPLTADDEVVMVRQYRHGASAVTLEIPGGLLDPGEDPAEAALRECLEETGFQADSAESLGVVNPNPAIHAHKLFSFIARGARRVADIQNTEREVTEVELVPLAGLPDLLRAGRIDHGLVAATLWRFLHDHA